MTIEQFIYLNLLMIVLISVLFLWGRRGARSPSRLNLSPSDGNQPSNFNSLKTLSKLTQHEPVAEPTEVNWKDVNPMFMYNGHTWDAFEVIGVPLGSSIEEIKKAFDESLAKSDPNSHDFLKTALTTILSEMKNQGYKP